MSVIVDGSNGLIFNDASTQTTAATGFGFKNRIINGAMIISQRSGTSTITPGSTDYVIDRFHVAMSQSSKFTTAQSSVAPTGFVNSVLITSSSAYTNGSTDYFVLRQAIEGNNVADLGWGAAGAQTVTLSFWVRSSLTGTFGAALYNGNGTRSYPFSYTINSANTWEQKSITISGDTSGTWAATTGTGLYVSFSLGAGSTFNSTANAWAGGFYTQPSGSVSVVGTSGATFYVTGVQLEKGSTATAFDYRDYGTETLLCQRYYNRMNLPQYVGVLGFCDSTSEWIGMVQFPVVMRDAPTFSSTGFGSALIIRRSGATSNTTSLYQTYAGTQNCRLYATASSLTAGQCVALASQEGASTFLAWSAEL